MGGEPIGGRVDVARLMEEIKERVRQRKAAGVYSEEEVRRIAQMELEVTEAQPGLRDELEQRLAVLNDTWETASSPVVSSHRRGIGPAIVAAKRLLHGVTKPYVNIVLGRQVGFNSILVQLLNAFIPPVAEAARKMDDLSLAVHERLAVTHAEGLRRHRELGQRVDALLTELATLRAAVSAARPAAGPVALVAQPPLPAGLGAPAPGTYVAFEDRHRGTRDEIRQRQRAYLDLFPTGPILDVGCGRGEFLELCREAKLDARGIDVDAGMVARCREAGLEVELADALTFLGRLPDGSLGGIFCAQVIEHLPAEAFLALVQLAAAKLRPGGTLLCETPNPTCLTVFSGAFYVDLTHIKPIHPQAATFVFEAAGLRQIEVRYVNPYPPDMRLRPLEPLWYMRRYEEALLQTLNDNFTQLNDLLWGAQDYAIIGRRS